MVDCRILGDLDVLAGTERISLGGARQRAVFALLITCAPAAVSADRLIDELWTDQPPPTAAHAVQVYVSALRKALRTVSAQVALRSSASGYWIDVDPHLIDARRFERLIDDGERCITEDPWRAREELEHALALWRGRPLDDLRQFDFARREADRLRELHLRGAECLAEARLACGEYSPVISTLTGLVAANPLRERPRRLLMLALYQAGRHVEALAAYREGCAALSEVGLQPGPELRELEALILRHDESLKSLEPPTSSTLPVQDAAGSQIRPRLAAFKRKLVTALCCDLAGSPGFGESVDPEARLELADRCFQEMRPIIERHGGTVVSSIGNSITAVFGTPRVREDDALRAVRAAVELRDRLRALTIETDAVIGPRTAVNSGLALVSASDHFVLGDAVEHAARLGHAAEPGQILVGSETLALVRDAVEVEPDLSLGVDGNDGSVVAWRLVALDPLAPGHRRRFDAPLVGRERELGLLHGAWERMLQERCCHLFTLFGAAGIGKSRLVGELLGSLGDAATVLSGRCLHYGDGITFWPLIEALTVLDDAARPLIDRIAAGAAARPEELFWEIRQVLETAALERPVILHIDDLQWAEPMLLDLLDHVAELSHGAPILLLCAARPELLEERPTWGGGKVNASSALLEALTPGDCERLLDHLGDGVDQESRARVITASAGNPLFLEELIALARERGARTVPPSIQALLAARLERLGPDEREVLECGAIEGEVFHSGAVRALGGARVTAQVRSTLEGLVRKELIRPVGAVVGDDAFRFRHLLIRDAVYESLPKASRIRLHESFARWLDRDARGLSDFDEIAGWHLEQVVRYQQELGRDVDRSVAGRGAEALHAAGRRAAQRGDTVAARKLLDRAHSLAVHEPELYALIAIDLAEALMEGGDLTQIDSLLAIAEQNPHTAAHARLIRFHWRTLAEPDDAPRRIEAELPDMLRQLAAAGDESGLVKAHLAGWWAASQLALVDPATEHALLAARHARNAGDEGLRSRALAMYVVALFYSSKDVAALTKELDTIETEELGPYPRTLVTVGRSEVMRLTGDMDGARRLMRRAIEQFRTMGIQTMAAACENYLAWAEVSHGDPGGSLPGLRKAEAELARLGERGFRSTVQATLAQVYERLGECQRAGAAVDLADELTGSEDHLNKVLIFTVRARLALAGDDPDAAEAWARKAVEHALRTDISFMKGDAHLELARVLFKREHRPEARAAAQAAIGFYEIRDDQPRAGQARAVLARINFPVSSARPVTA